MSDDVPLDWLLPILVHMADRTSVLMGDPSEVAMTDGEIRAGIASGTLERGTVEREAQGLGTMPLVGAFLDIERVQRITPPLAPLLRIVALEVVGLGYGWSAVTTKWRVPVVAIREVRAR
ncbi:MAG: hypothetical protein LH650_14985 [Chloroflexi bacterium]|nr:hypothetical protein [Chloroflexota bacterium]